MAPFRKLCQALALPLAVIFLYTTISPNMSHAGLVSTEQVVAQESGNADRVRVQDFLQRDDVRQQFESLGVDPGEAAARVATLSDAEVRTIAGKLDTMPAGQGALGAVLVTIAVIFLVLLLTDLLGLTNVFPFIRR